MADSKQFVINKFYGGQVRDDKSKIIGSAFNMEEIDIFTNGDYFQAEQIFSADSMPASTEIYAHVAAPTDIVYGYGKETAGNKVRVVSVASGGASAPSTFSTLFTSADATNLAYTPSPLVHFTTSEDTQGYLYFLTNASGTIKVGRFKINGGTDFITTDSASAQMTLTGLTGSFDNCSMRVIFGELMIMNGKFIAKIDKDGVFTNAAFTLPSDWIATDICPVSDVAVVLSRNVNRLANLSRGYWWDLSSLTQFDDQFDLPIGGPQWIVNQKETIKMFCAINGRGRFYQLSGAFPGAVPLELPGLGFINIAAETSTQKISPPKTVGKKDNILYFGVYKTDKTGLYALGQLDSDKPTALLLSKRFSTGDYSTHLPIGVLIHGPNFYASYFDGTNNVCARCATNNSPNRSSNAVYESLWLDAGVPLSNKAIDNIFITTYPLPASTAVVASLATDYSSSYTALTRPDGSTMNGTSDVIGFFNANSIPQKVARIKVALTSSTTNSPKVTSVGFTANIHKEPATK